MRLVLVRSQLGEGLFISCFTLYPVQQDRQTEAGKLILRHSVSIKANLFNIETSRGARAQACGRKHDRL